MRLTRVFVETPLVPGASLTLPEAASGHLARVLRLGVGDDCIVFDGRGGEYRARIASVGKRAVTVSLVEHDPVERESPLRVLLLQGLARGERMDLIVQKATELGVAAIRPVHTLHSGVRLDELQAARKLSHWRGIAVSACEQCRRNRIPEILAPVSLADAIATAPAGDRWMLSLAPDRTELPRGAAVPHSWVSVLIGPEGGLAGSEEAQAAAASFRPLALGPRVLRTETAALAALAVLGALQGDLAAQ